MNGKILVIDDEDKILKLLRIQLSKAGYDVKETKRGKDAFRILKEHSFETIICDLKMPEISGVEVLEYIKKKYDTIPVIILTGFVEVDMAIEVMKKGAFDFLVKPVKRDEMIVTVEKAINHKRLIEENLRLKEENRNYQEMLKRKVEENAIEFEICYKQSEKNIMNLVRILSEALENKDPYKRGHSNWVSYYAQNIARVFNFSKIDLKALEYSALLHDCGMIGIRGAILNKKGKLSEVEYDHIKKHPLIGEDIIKKVDFLKLSREPIRNHHEHYDGQGYPDGLKGEDIPFSARIIAVADSFDALTNGRPFRDAMSAQHALSILKENRGSQFDQKIVDVFIKNRIYNK